MAKTNSLLGQEDTDKIARRAAQISVSAIKEITLLASKIPDVVSLSWGLPSFETPNYIKEALIREIKQNSSMGKYSLFIGLPALRQEVAVKIAAEIGVQLDPEKEILITAGAMEGLQSTILSLVDRGDEVILISPCFPSHIEQVLLAEGKPVFVPLIEEEGWKLDLDVFKPKITPKTKALIITNPANPTGNVFSRQELEQLTRLALEHDLLVITDETYRFLVYDDRPLFCLGQVPELKERLVAVSSFSKEYAMTGFRVGYLYGPEKLIKQIMKVHDATIVCAPTISQLAALAALRGPQTGTQRFVEKLGQRRELICDHLDQLEPHFSYVKPEGAYYVFPQTTIPRIKNSQEAALKLLNEARVATVPGIAFGPNGENHLRLSFCGSEEEINLAFTRIKNWLPSQ